MYIHIFIVTDNNKFCILTSPLYTCFSTKSSVQYTLECRMTLCGIKVIELAGLAPGPFCGMVLSDFGASVIRIDKIVEDISYDCLGNGKQSLAVNLKHEKGVEIFKKLCKTSDIVLDTYRAGVMESLGIGPNVLLKENPRLIYARLSGFGQYGRLANRPGHDMNFLALTGLLSLMHRSNEKPRPPLTTIADFAGGGLMCAFGISMALIERVSSGKGQIVDCNMVEGTAYLASWIYRSQNMPFWGHKDGKSIFNDGMHFYQTYETKDGKYMAVGAIEPKFYREVLKGLGLSQEQCPQFGDVDEITKIFTKRFLEKTQQEWNEIFIDIDACVTPVLSLKQATEHPHNVERKTFVPGNVPEVIIPGPAPKLSRTPAESHALDSKLIKGTHTVQLLKSLNYSEEDIAIMESEGIILVNRKSKM